MCRPPHRSGRSNRQVRRSMKRPPPRTLTVLVDDREKNPLRFPATLKWWDGSRSHVLGVRTLRRRMITGDYALQGYEESCLIERKGRLEELYTNFCTVKDASRMHRCLGRLVEACRHPVLLLDIPVANALTATQYAPYPPRLWDTMFRRLLRDKISVLWVPQGRSPQSAARSGELVLRYIWAAAWNDLVTPPPNGA